MSNSSLLDGKRVLAVDDEQDILTTLEELLPMCKIEKAASFEEAEKLLTTQDFDIVILDIMGVDGYGLLDIATKKNITAVMLTAYAFTPKDMVKSLKGGAASYIPKEKISEIAAFLTDILKAEKEGIHPWEPWEKRLPSSFFEKRFGAAWKDVDKDFWKTFRDSIRARKAQSDK